MEAGAGASGRSIVQEIVGVAVDLLDTNQRSVDGQSIGGTVEVTEFQAAPGTGQIDGRFVGTDAGRTGSATCAVLQLYLRAVKQAIVSLAVSADDDFRLKLELVVRAVRSIVVVVSSEELGITAERNSDLRLS